jgi:formylglycine-generating enzyme required for sulfatase activity
VPASVTVAAGQTSATFTVATRTVTSNATAVITAKLGTDSKTVKLTVTSPPGIAGPYDMLFVSIPAGEFMMGCSPGDTECNSVESPRHRLQIAKDFEIGMFEVTQAQWLAVMGTSPSYGKGKNPPVETVSWYDVPDFMTKRNALSRERTHQGFFWRTTGTGAFSYCNLPRASTGQTSSTVSPRRP